MASSFSLSAAIRPHRVAGGIGLLLMGTGIASVTQRSPGSPRPFYSANISPGGAAAARAFQERAFADGGPSEPEGARRSFSLSAAMLPAYRVTDLSAFLRAGEQLELLALSHKGEVLGTVSPPNGNPVSPGQKRAAPRTFAARWYNGALQRYEIPPGVHRVVAGDINNRGEVAAVSIRYRRGKPPYNRLLLYRPGAASCQDLGTLDPEYAPYDTPDPAKMRGVSENLLSLNDQGTLLANVGNKSWFWRADGTVSPLDEAIALDLNNTDTAVGFAGALSGGAVMWRNATANGRPSRIPLLPTQKNTQFSGQPYWRGAAQCVNEKGEAVITVPVDTSNGLRRLGRTAYYLVRGGKLQLIAQMRGYQRTRVRINDHGDIIGMSDTDQDLRTVTPILYKGRAMYDLSDAAHETGWKIVAGIDINNKKQILAYGTQKDRGDTPVPILLTPAAAGGP